MFQLLKGCLYLHANWIMHRDLKPANVMLTSRGKVKIGDLGLAKVYQSPLQPVYGGEKAVVTLWYRAPELLLGAKRYTPNIDLWSIGCIFGELLSLKPMFRGKKVKFDDPEAIPFQKDQLLKVVDILGIPTHDDWPLLRMHPDYRLLEDLLTISRSSQPIKLKPWYEDVLTRAPYFPDASPGNAGLALLESLLTYDPLQRIDAASATKHHYFDSIRGHLDTNCFWASNIQYPLRTLFKDDGRPVLAGSKRSGFQQASCAGRQFKRPKMEA